MSYTFYITYSSVTTEVFPLNFMSTALVDQKEANQEFYRRKYQGELVFGGQGNKADFDYFHDIEANNPCEKLELTIYRDADIYWEGYFSTTDGSWDLDECTFLITPFTTDYYTDFLDVGDVEYNILDQGLIPITTSLTLSGSTYTYTRNYKIIDLLNFFIDKVSLTITLDSDFLTAVNNPVTLIANRFNYLTLAQKSDIKNPAGDPATIAMLSFNQLMDILRCMNLYWSCDGTNFFVKHLYEYSYTAGIDLRTEEIAESNNKYKYAKEEMPKYEKFKWMEAANEDFVGQDIYYVSPCVNQDPRSNIKEYVYNVTTDIEYIIDCVAGDETLISNDGWVLLANRFTTPNYYVWSQTGILSGVNKFNNDLSWANLHNALFKHGRVMITGYMNGTLQTFYSALKTIEQPTQVIYCEEFDPADYITTELGEDYLNGLKGYVNTAELNPDGLIKLKLRYGPEDNANSGISDAKKMTITETMTVAQTSTFTILLNQPADVQIVLNIDIEVSTLLGVTCHEDKDFTINVGELTTVDTISWCTSSIPGDPETHIDTYTKTFTTPPAGTWEVTWVTLYQGTWVDP